MESIIFLHNLIKHLIKKYKFEEIINLNRFVVD